MNYKVLIEPADDQRRAFARWCISQSPRIETATAFGTEVDAETFKRIPEPLLVGAYVDGRLYRHVAVAPAAEETAAPAEDPQATVRARRRRKAAPDGS